MDQSKKTFEKMRQQARATAPLRWSRKELAQIALLKGAHQETIAPLLGDCPVRVLASGDILARAGEASEALYLVLSGRLRMEDAAGMSPDTLIRAGDAIGELFLLKKAVNAWTVSAVEQTRVLVIDRTAAWKLIRASHEIARNWLSLFAERTSISGIIAGSEELKTSHLRPTTYDELTGLHNREWLEIMLPRQVARSGAGHEPLGLLLVEVDGYTDYVTRFGPAAGDRACCITAETLTDNLRPTDLLAVCGPAQFAAVLVDTNGDNACLVGERVRHAVHRAGALMSSEGNMPALTVSVGVAQLQPASGASAFFAAAESALQAAKASGGNRVGRRD